MREERFRTDKAIRTSPRGWGVKCDGCGAWVTKWDWTRDDALAVAAVAPCPKCGRKVAP